LKTSTATTETFYLIKKGLWWLCCPSYTVLIVFEKFKNFKDGREDLLDGARNGRPSTSRNADTTANDREIVI
jgi:hypothetical protein